MVRGQGIQRSEFIPKCTPDLYRSVIQRHGNHVDREVLKQVVTYTGNRKTIANMYIFVMTFKFRFVLIEIKTVQGISIFVKHFGIHA